MPKIHFVALPKLPKETAQLMLQHVFRLHAIPAIIVSHLGPQFVSALWREFCAQMRTTVSISSGFSPAVPWSNRMSQVEDLETVLRCLAIGEPASWEDQLLWAEYAHNALVSSATKISPFQCEVLLPDVFVPESRERRNLSLSTNLEKGLDNSVAEHRDIQPRG